MSTAKRKLRPYIAEETAAARAAFRDRYGEDLRFARVLVVIAAFNEEDSLGEVLHHIPAEVSGLAVDALVVDDGSTDLTAGVAEKFDRVRVARLTRNCGHGVALRLGYQLAADHGAEYIVTLDADMQWDPREMPTVLPPLLEGEADFVIGSRVLGSAETDDAYLGAADRCHLPGLPGHRATHHHAQALRRREQEGAQRPLRRTLRTHDPRHLASRAVTRASPVLEMKANS